MDARYVCNGNDQPEGYFEDHPLDRWGICRALARLWEIPTNEGFEGKVVEKAYTAYHGPRQAVTPAGRDRITKDTKTLKREDGAMIPDYLRTMYFVFFEQPELKKHEP